MTPDSPDSFLSHLFPAPQQPARPHSSGSAALVELRPARQRRVSVGAVSRTPEGGDESAGLSAPPPTERSHTIPSEREPPVIAQIIKDVHVDRERDEKQPHPIEKTEGPRGSAATERVSLETKEERAVKAAGAPNFLREEKRSAERRPVEPETLRSVTPRVPTEPVHPPEREDESGRERVTTFPTREVETHGKAAAQPAPALEREQPSAIGKTQPGSEAKMRPKAAVESPAPIEVAPPEVAPPPHKEIASASNAAPVAATIQPANVAKKSSPVPTMARDESVAPPSKLPLWTDALPGIGLQPSQQTPAVDTKPAKLGTPSGVMLRIGRIEILTRPAPVRRTPRVSRGARSHQIEPRALTGRSR